MFSGCVTQHVMFWHPSDEQMVLIILIPNSYIMATNSASRQKKRPKIASSISVSKWGQIRVTHWDGRYALVHVEGGPGACMRSWLGLWCMRGMHGTCPSVSHLYRPARSHLWRPVTTSPLLRIREGHRLVPFAWDFPSGLWFLTRQQAAWWGM